MSDIVRRYAARLGEAVGRAVAPMTEELGRLRANVTLLLSEIADLKATCAALGNEQAQEKELRLRAEAEVARMVDKFAELMESGARDVARLEDECRRAVAAEVELKRVAYEKLDGCRKVVEKTIIPALVEAGGEMPTYTLPGCRCATCLARDALAAARKLLED